VAIAGKRVDDDVVVLSAGSVRGVLVEVSLFLPFGRRPPPAGGAAGRGEFALTDGNGSAETERCWLPDPDVQRTS
jgi:hypothetical protein